MQTFLLYLKENYIWKQIYVQIKDCVILFSFLPAMSFRASCMVWICWETADSILSSNLLNSSKQPQAPTWHSPTKIRPMAWKKNTKSITDIQCTCKGAVKLEFCITYFMSFIKWYLEIKVFITVEDQHKSSKLISQSFHRLSFTSTSRTLKETIRLKYKPTIIIAYHPWLNFSKLLTFMTLYTFCLNCRQAILPSVYTCYRKTFSCLFLR